MLDRTTRWSVRRLVAHAGAHARAYVRIVGTSYINLFESSFDSAVHDRRTSAFCPRSRPALGGRRSPISKNLFRSIPNEKKEPVLFPAKTSDWTGPDQTRLGGGGGSGSDDDDEAVAQIPRRRGGNDAASGEFQNAGKRGSSTRPSPTLIRWRRSESSEEETVPNRMRSGCLFTHKLTPPKRFSAQSTLSPSCCFVFWAQQQQQ